jgi:pilus assembly protein CpaF
MNSTPSHWIDALLADPEVTDLCLNAGTGVFADRGQGLVACEGPPAGILETEIRDWTLTRLAQAGRSWDAKFPFIDATLESGHRLHAAFPPLARPGILVSLRRLPRVGQKADSDEGTRRWQGSAAAYDLLRRSALAGDTILISGATGSGKTTLLNDLLAELPAEERILALEDTPELAPRHPHFVSLQSRPANADGCGEVTLRMLLKQALRMRPDRILLGECRGGEVLELLQCLNTGHRGTLATLHANSPRDALRRIELLCLLGGEGALPQGIIRDLLASGVQWVAQTDRDALGHRHIREIARIEGREGDTLLLRPVVSG